MLLGLVLAIAIVMGCSENGSERSKAYQNQEPVTVSASPISLNIEPELVEFRLCEFSGSALRLEFGGFIASDVGLGRTDMRFLIGERMDNGSLKKEIILCATSPSIYKGYSNMSNREESYIKARQLKIDGKSDIWIVARTD